MESQLAAEAKQEQSKAKTQTQAQVQIQVQIQGKEEELADAGKGEKPEIKQPEEIATAHVHEEKKGRFDVKAQSKSDTLKSVSSEKILAAMKNDKVKTPETSANKVVSTFKLISAPESLTTSSSAPNSVPKAIPPSRSILEPSSYISTKEDGKKTDAEEAKEKKESPKDIKEEAKSLSKPSVKKEEKKDQPKALADHKEEAKHNKAASQISHIKSETHPEKEPISNFEIDVEPSTRPLMKPKDSTEVGPKKVINTDAIIIQEISKENAIKIQEEAEHSKKSEKQEKLDKPEKPEKPEKLEKPEKKEEKKHTAAFPEEIKEASKEPKPAGKIPQGTIKQDIAESKPDTVRCALQKDQEEQKQKNPIIPPILYIPLRESSPVLNQVPINSHRETGEREGVQIDNVKHLPEIAPHNRGRVQGTVATAAQNYSDAENAGSEMPNDPLNTDSGREASAEDDSQRVRFQNVMMNNANQHVPHQYLPRSRSLKHREKAGEDPEIIQSPTSKPVAEEQKKPSIRPEAHNIARGKKIPELNLKRIMNERNSHATIEHNDYPSRGYQKGNSKKAHIDNKKRERLRECLNSKVDENKHWEKKFVKYYKKFDKLQGEYDKYISLMQKTQQEMSKVLSEMGLVKHDVEHDREYLDSMNAGHKLRDNSDEDWMKYMREVDYLKNNYTCMWAAISKFKRGKKTG